MQAYGYHITIVIPNRCETAASLHALLGAGPEPPRKLWQPPRRLWLGTNKRIDPLYLLFIVGSAFHTVTSTVTDGVDFVC